MHAHPITQNIQMQRMMHGITYCTLQVMLQHLAANVGCTSCSCTSCTARCCGIHALSLRAMTAYTSTHVAASTALTSYTHIIHHEWKHAVKLTATRLHAQLPYLPTAETQQHSKPMAANQCQFSRRCNMHSHMAQAGLAWSAHQLQYILHLLSWLTQRATHSLCCPCGSHTLFGPAPPPRPPPPPISTAAMQASTAPRNQ
jgi:hypothetical protein